MNIWIELFSDTLLILSCFVKSTERILILSLEVGDLMLRSRRFNFLRMHPVLSRRIRVCSSITSNLQIRRFDILLNSDDHDY